MQAKEHFIGTSEEMRVTIVDCDLAIARGDFDKVVGRLSAVPPESSHASTAAPVLHTVWVLFFYFTRVLTKVFLFDR